jgi:hypothetical protein
MVQCSETPIALNVTPTAGTLYIVHGLYQRLLFNVYIVVRLSKWIQNKEYHYTTDAIFTWIY